MTDKELEMSIWIVDDDIEDHELIREMFADLKSNYPLELFQRAEDLLKKLSEVRRAPFIIISDVNLGGMNGFELREKLLSAPNKKFHSVPFIFWTTSGSESQIVKAYELKGHGFFIKEAKFSEWKKSLTRIIEYWLNSKMPAKEDKPEKPQL